MKRTLINFLFLSTVLPENILSKKMSADFLFCKQITEKNSTEHTWNLKFEDFFTIFDKMGKAKKLKISKAPRNTPLEENITKVSAVYGRILVKSSEIYTRVFFDASRDLNGAKDYKVEN